MDIDFDFDFDFVARELALVPDAALGRPAEDRVIAGQISQLGQVLTQNQRQTLISLIRRILGTD